MKRSHNSISIPARVSLWLGVIVLVVAYRQREVALLIIGSIFICVGCGLWVAFGSASSLYERCEYALYRILKKTPVRNLQAFYNFEARIDKKRSEYQLALKTEIKRAEKLLQSSPSKSKKGKLTP